MSVDERISPEELNYGIDVAGLDMASLGDALRAVIADAMADPLRMSTWFTGLALAEQNVGMNMLRRLGGGFASPSPFDTGATRPVQGDTGASQSDAGSDKRFAEAEWRSNPFLAGLVEDYQARSHAAFQLVDSTRLPETTKRKARFAMQLICDAYAPSNIPWLNPGVLKEATDTGGMSLLRGLQNFMEDAANNEGYPRQVDKSGFELGTNLAATPGRVVMRNELMELIAYEPQTAQVHETPLLCSPPWINKYYIMDLAHGRSFVEWAVQRGHQTFMISYRNPDEQMSHYTMHHYLRDGVLAAIDAVQDITGAPRVNLAALCLGGTLALIAMAYLAAHDQGNRIASTTVTNTLIDFSIPGDLGVFTDEDTIRRLEKRIRERGYLHAREMARTFDWLRSRDLIWSYVINNWFKGKNPPAFDILAWNNDSTHMPVEMHSEYLRACYLHNAIVKPGAFTIGDTPIDLGKITAPLYVLGAENDHIAPWRATYLTTQHVGGESKYVLTNAGHIAGIVNPPGGKKTWHYTQPATKRGESADEWLETADRHQGSWWNDWADWAATHGGAMREPYRVPGGEPAPGRYVRNETGDYFAPKLGART